MIVNHIPFRKVRTPTNIQSHQHTDRQRSFNEHGFSLLELLIVVGIIGALATIALPQFQVFLQRSKQSQGKIMASNVNTALKTFYAEWGMYFGDFRDIGYAPEGYFYYTLGLESRGVRLPSHYPKPAASGFGGSIGAGQPMRIKTAGYSVLRYYCNGDGEADYGVPEGHPNCEVHDTYVGTMSELKEDGYLLYIAGNTDEDIHLDLWTFCYNHYDTPACPNNEQGLHFLYDDIKNDSPTL